MFFSVAQYMVLSCIYGCTVCTVVAYGRILLECFDVQETHMRIKLTWVYCPDAPFDAEAVGSATGGA